MPSTEAEHKRECCSVVDASIRLPKVLQERLGHKSIKITMDTYSHALPTMQEGIADVLDAVVYGEAR